MNLGQQKGCLTVRPGGTEMIKYSKRGLCTHTERERERRKTTGLIFQELTKLVQLPPPLPRPLPFPGLTPNQASAAGDWWSQQKARDSKSNVNIQWRTKTNPYSQFCRQNIRSEEQKKVLAKNSQEIIKINALILPCSGWRPLCVEFPAALSPEEEPAQLSLFL